MRSPGNTVQYPHSRRFKREEHIGTTLDDHRHGTLRRMTKRSRLKSNDFFQVQKRESSLSTHTVARCRYCSKIYAEIIYRFQNSEFYQTGVNALISH